MNTMNLSKSNLLKCLYTILIPVVSGIVGLILLAIAFLLPSSMIKDNVAKSLPIFQQETDYFSVTSGISGSQLDNYTDAIYLNEAMVSRKDASIIECILSGYQFIASEEEGTPVANLERVINNPENVSIRPITERFFNGYEVVVKPLLCITDYAGIRQINIFIVLSLSAPLFILMAKKGLSRFIVPFVLAIAFINPLTVSLSMTFVGFYYCMIIPSVIILAMKPETLARKGWLVFGFIGACTFYFNMNYFQLLSFGVPLVFYLFVNGFPEKTRSAFRLFLSLFIP